MCGIAGLWDLEGRADLGRLQRMSALMRTRGPDDEGMVLLDPAGPRSFTLGGPDTPADVFASPLPWAPGRRVPAGPPPEGAHYPLALLHRRLSIVDLSPGGHEPMCDVDGRCWLVFNGEIYNWVELREELRALGERFASACDAEVILAAWRRWGRECLSRFNGMFAFALWDAATNELFCARDRFGVKPLHYQWDGRRFAFASDPRALALTQPAPIRPRLAAIRDLLALDWVDHARETFFEGLWQLPAAHWLSVGPRGFSSGRWWSLDPERRAPGTPADWEARFRDLFDDAVRLRMRADVEVGSCLSGGLDSSAVVTTAARFTDRPLRAFTCAYDEGPAFDERPYVRAVVEAAGARSDVVVPDGRDFWEVFDALTFEQGEPTAGPGLYSQRKVMELAHRHGLKVLLDGQGGDETLAGYARYLPIRLRDRLAAGAWGEAVALWGPVAARLGAVTALALTVEPWLPPALVAPLRRRFGQGKDRVIRGPLARLRGDPPPRPPRAFGSGLANQLAFDTLQRLLPSLLRYEDRNSMAFSIETRLPFLDVRLVEFAFALPDGQKLEGTVSKAILRRSLAARIPAPVLERRDKMGFETPTDAWLRTRHARAVRERLLGAGPHLEWMDRDALAAELDAWFEGRRAIGLQVWRWLSLQSWARRFVATDPRLVDRAPDPVLHAGHHLSYVEVARRAAFPDGA